MVKTSGALVSIAEVGAGMVKLSGLLVSMTGVEAGMIGTRRVAEGWEGEAPPVGSPAPIPEGVPAGEAEQPARRMSNGMRFLRRFGTFICG